MMTLAAIRSRVRGLAVAALFAGFLPAPLEGAVKLVADSQAEAIPGGAFSLELRLAITADEEVTGLDYFWQAHGDLSGLLGLIEREYAEGEFSEVYFFNSTVLALPGRLLDPENAWNLGGGVPDLEVPLKQGDWLVARYVFAVSPAAPPGVYTLSTVSPPGLGWVGPSGEDFPDSPFSQQAWVSLTIVPEPGVFFLLAAGFLLAGCRACGRSRMG